MEIVYWILVAWAVISFLNFIIELIPTLGGDGVQPGDITWWICRPFNFRGWALFSLPMLIGLLVWIGLIAGCVFAVHELMHIY